MVSQVANKRYFPRSESAMSRKGIGDRMKAKTNVATHKLASALGFQVRIKIIKNLLYIFKNFQL